MNPPNISLIFIIIDSSLLMLLSSVILSSLHFLLLFFFTSYSLYPIYPLPPLSLFFAPAFVLYYSSLPYWSGFLLSHGADPQPVCLSVCAPVHGQISLSSELQPGSLPPDADADESSSDMLVIVDDPVSSAPQSRATNSPSSVSGSVSDNMNGERENPF